MRVVESNLDKLNSVGLLQFCSLLLLIHFSSASSHSVLYVRRRFYLGAYLTTGQMKMLFDHVKFNKIEYSKVIFENLVFGSQCIIHLFIVFNTDLPK